MYEGSYTYGLIEAIQRYDYTVWVPVGRWAFQSSSIRSPDTSRTSTLGRRRCLPCRLKGNQACTLDGFRPFDIQMTILVGNSGIEP